MSEHEQGSEGWLLDRAGHATASRFCDVMAKVKTGEAATRRDYRWELVAERMTNKPCRQYENAAMRRGRELEPEAREAYEAQSGNLVIVPAFIRHPTATWVGASPDGQVDGDGTVEIKCPDSMVIHAQTLSGGMPEEHKAQVQGVMWVTGRSWCDFISYDPRYPEDAQLYVERVMRDDAYIARLSEEVFRFLDEVERQHKSIVALRSAA